MGMISNILTKLRGSGIVGLSVGNEEGAFDGNVVGMVGDKVEGGEVGTADG